MVKCDTRDSRGILAVSYMWRFVVPIVRFLIGVPLLAFLALKLLETRMIFTVPVTLFFAEEDERAFFAFIRRFAKVCHVQVIENVIQVVLFADWTSVQEFLAVRYHVIVRD